MADEKKKTTPDIGSIAWLDLTADDAPQVRDFYRRVVGWAYSDVNMGEYTDYLMHRPTDGAEICGVCHARGANADLPAAWLVYISVADLDASLQRCRELEGEVVVEPRTLGAHGRFAVIRDPAGAVSALFEQVVPEEPEPVESARESGG